MRVIGLISGTSHDGMDDLGPANALVDAAVVRMSGGAERYDREGRRAATGRVDEELLADLLAEPYYA